MDPDMPQNKLWVTLASIVLAGAVLLFIVDRASHEKGIVRQQAESSQYASTFNVDAKGLAKPTSTNFVYRVVGAQGTTATITYAEQSGAHVTVTHARLPWSIAIARQGGTDLPPKYGMAPFVEVQANTHNANATVTCQAFARGTLNDQETNKGQYVTVSCGFAF
jgi:Mycobacterium membrane protein